LKIKVKKLNILLTIFILLTSCNSIQDAGKVLRNEKVRTTDEFLVKKRNPLVLPPKYEEVPEPGSISSKKKRDDDKIKEMLNAPKKEKFNKNKSSSVEETILNQIRK